MYGTNDTCSTVLYVHDDRGSERRVGTGTDPVSTGTVLCVCSRDDRERAKEYLIKIGREGGREGGREADRLTGRQARSLGYSMPLRYHTANIHTVPVS